MLVALGLCLYSSHHFFAKRAWHLEVFTNFSRAMTIPSCWPDTVSSCTSVQSHTSSSPRIPMYTCYIDRPLRGHGESVAPPGRDEGDNVTRRVSSANGRANVDGSCRNKFFLVISRSPCTFTARAAESTSDTGNKFFQMLGSHTKSAVSNQIEARFGQRPLPTRFLEWGMRV